MPNWNCPRCQAQLREEDCWVTEGPKWDRHFGNLLTMNVECWMCSWGTSWAVANVVEAEEVKLG